MRRIFFPLLFTLFVFNCCNETAPKTENPVPEPESSGVSIKLAELGSDKDLVCGMNVEEGAIADTASYEGKVYGFCASECKHAFLENPTQYLSQK